MRLLKRCLAAVAAALAAFAALAACETRVMVVSDIHYLAPELYEGSELFTRVLKAGDGKLTQHGETLLAALAREIDDVRPDALVVTGDLSFNGERLSHEGLAAWLKGVEDGGVAAWVIPGNHDINVSAPRGFAGDGYYDAEGVDEAAFSAIYADFMLPPSPGANLSYAAKIDDALWIAMTDVAFYRDGAQTFGLFTAGHGDWLEDVLSEAGERGAQVVTATHQNLLAHTEFLRDSFVMFGSEGMAALARRHGVRLNLSGHIHAQHIVRADGLADAALGAFCTWPHRYALLTLEDDGGLIYEARSLSGARLSEGFLDMSRQWYYGIAFEKTRAALADRGLSEDDRDAMADYAARFTLDYFSGTYKSNDPAWKRDRAYTLWLQNSDSPMWQYMDLVMNEPCGENLRYSAD